MAITISPEESTVNRDTDFSLTISASGDSEELIESVAISKNFDDDEVIIEGATASGQHTTAFEDVLKYVSKGSSDKIESPTTVIGTGNIPPNQDLFSFICDTASEIERTYNVTVTHDGGSTSSFTHTVTVNNNLDGYVTWITNYVG
jgi:hypothetical protein